MPRDFNINLNKTILDTKIKPEFLGTDDDMNTVIRTADEIIEVFAKNNTSMEDAWLILASLADSIYMYAQTGGDL